MKNDLQIILLKEFTDDVVKNPNNIDCVSYEDISMWCKIYDFLNTNLIRKNNVCLFEGSEYPFLEDLSLIGKFYAEDVCAKECIAHLRTDTGKFVFLQIWIAKVTGIPVTYDYLRLRIIFDTKNVWKTFPNRKVESIDEVIEFAEKVSIPAFNEPLCFLKSNLNFEEESCNPEFVSTFSDIDFSRECSAIKTGKFISLTIEEWIIKQLLCLCIEKTLDVKIDKDEHGTLYFTIENYCDIWLDDLKTYFNNQKIDFFLNTCAYLFMECEISKEDISRHFAIFIQAAKTEHINELIRTLPFQVIIKVLKDKQLEKKVSQTNEYKDFRIWQQSLNEFEDLKTLEKYNLLVRKQKNVLEEYWKNEFRNCASKDDVNFIALLSDSKHLDLIDEETFKNMQNKFTECLDKRNMENVDRLVWLMEYSCFLDRVKERASQVDKELVEKEQIRTKGLIETLNNQLEMHSWLSWSVSARDEEIRQSTDKFLINPISYICENMMVKKDEFEELVNGVVSQFDTSDFSTVIEVNPDSLVEREFVAGEFEEMVECYVEKILPNKTFNHVQMQHLHNDWASGYYKSCFSLNIQTVYERLQLLNPDVLIEYSEEVKLAHVTQLFPLIEDKIREYGEKCYSILPISSRIDGSKKNKEPTDVLMTIIQSEFTKTGGLEDIGALMFLYNVLYNTNSLNVRNECIHYRKFCKNGDIEVAFRLGVVCMYLIEDMLGNTSILNIEEESKKLE